MLIVNDLLTKIFHDMNIVETTQTEGHNVTRKFSIANMLTRICLEYQYGTPI